MSSFQPTGDTWRQQTHTASGARAGFFQRFWAEFMDGIVLLVLFAIVAGVTKLPDDLIAIVVTFAYWTLLEGGASGQTLGKRAMRIRVASLEGGYPIGYQRAFVRTLGRILSYIPFCLGYFWMLWSPERQTWHDMLSQAVVVPVPQFDPRPPR